MDRKGPDRRMLHPATALQRHLDRLPTRLDHRRRTRAVDRNSVARQVWIRLADCGVHPFLWSRERRRDRHAARLHQSRHIGGATRSLANAKDQNASWTLATLGYRRKTD